jgi:hypothetical protein
MRSGADAILRLQGRLQKRRSEIGREKRGKT